MDLHFAVSATPSMKATAWPGRCRMRPRHHHGDLDHGTIRAAGELDVVSGDTVSAGASPGPVATGLIATVLMNSAPARNVNVDTPPSVAVATQGPGFEQSTVV